MSSDTPQKPKRGILVYYDELEDGSLRLTLDDAVQDAERPALWKRKNLFTYKDFDAEELERLEVSEGWRFRKAS